jgi:hypothetical protein
MSWIDEMLDHQDWADKVMASVSKGVTERPPVAGVKYKAFGVLPPEPGNLLGFAIGIALARSSSLTWSGTTSASPTPWL